MKKSWLGLGAGLWLAGQMAVDSPANAADAPSQAAFGTETAALQAF